MVDTKKINLYDEDENANCLSIGRIEDPGQDNKFAFRSSQCDKKVAYPICMIVSVESENETTTVSSTTISSSTESTSNNDSSSNELPTIDWSQVPCPSQSSRKKRGVGEKQNEKEKKEQDVHGQETTTQAVLASEKVYYLKGIISLLTKTI